MWTVIHEAEGYTLYVHQAGALIASVYDYPDLIVWIVALRSRASGYERQAAIKDGQATSVESAQDRALRAMKRMERSL